MKLKKWKMGYPNISTLFTHDYGGKSSSPDSQDVVQAIYQRLASGVQSSIHIIPERPLNHPQNHQTRENASIAVGLEEVVVRSRRRCSTVLLSGFPCSSRPMKVAGTSFLDRMGNLLDYGEP